MTVPIEPYLFQKRVATLLLSGSNVILQAPTGAGKTLAAMLPFLNALEKGHDFPHKCLYSVPMRVLAHQFVEDYEPRVKKAGRDEKIKVSIQTGDQARDPRLESDLIFATIDQTLSSFLLAPYSLSHSQANLNAAAVMGAYLVFDEFHLYDPISTLPTTLHMLQMLKGITPFILMTATFSSDMLEALAGLLDATVLPHDEEQRQELQALKSQQKERRYHVNGVSPLSAASVLEVHTNRSLVICNTVDRARRIHRELSDMTAKENLDIEVILLHSRFLREDRDVIEDGIRAHFGKDSPKDGSYIVVSTQAIEVGVDITSTRLHTELAPANAILQRAGRCARYPDEQGDVFIYRYAQGDTPGESLDLLESVMPYKSQEEEFSRTLDEFRARDGKNLKFTDEQDIVSAVHGPRDRQIIEQLQVDSYGHRKRIFAVMNGDSKGDAGNLIRDIKQQQVVIHENPNELLENPYTVPSFGLHPGTLQQYASLWLEKYQNDDSIPWVIKWLKEERDPDEEQANRRVYQWIDVHNSAKEIWGAPLVVVHPRLATYHPKLGFLPEQGGDWQTSLPERKDRSDREMHTYSLETYERHIDLVCDAAFNPQDGVWWEIERAARKLEEKYHWQPGSVRRATELAILLHDVGKLNIKWQKWVRDYQQKIGMPVPKDEAYAHTELKTDFHREAEQDMSKRPWHALEGAVAVLPILADQLGNNHPLTSAAFSAIARHHSANADSHRAFRLMSNVMAHVRLPFDGSVNLLGIDREMPSETGAKKFISDPSASLESFCAYLLIVRVLRRADQIGTAKGSGK